MFTFGKLPVFAPNKEMFELVDTDHSGTATPPHQYRKQNCFGTARARQWWILLLLSGVRGGA